MIGEYFKFIDSFILNDFGGCHDRVFLTPTIKNLTHILEFPSPPHYILNLFKALLPNNSLKARLYYSTYLAFLLDVRIKHDTNKNLLNQ